MGHEKSRLDLGFAGKSIDIFGALKNVFQASHLELVLVPHHLRLVVASLYSCCIYRKVYGRPEEAT